MQHNSCWILLNNNNTYHQTSHYHLFIEVSQLAHQTDAWACGLFKTICRFLTNRKKEIKRMTLNLNVISFQTILKWHRRICFFIGMPNSKFNSNSSAVIFFYLSILYMLRVTLKNVRITIRIIAVVVGYSEIFFIQF